MRKKSLQEIEDFYRNQGYEHEELRRVLEKDKEWQRIVKERKQRLSKKISLTKSETKKYVMSTDEDFEILARIKEIEKIKTFRKEDRILVKLIRTQLEHDWRTPLLKTLDKILQKYSKARA